MRAERRTAGLMKRSPRGTSPPHVVVRSIAFTPNALATLEVLAAEVTQRTGRKASVSAVVRALLRHTKDVPDVTSKLAALIEHEQANELVWGKPPRRD